MGKSSTSFDPEAKVTRAEYPTILLRVAGLMNRDANSAYSDVSEASWYNRSVAIASELGIVAGNSDGTYAPNASLSRMEAMVMVGRTIGVLGIAETLSNEEVNKLLGTFEDGASVPAWARASVALTIKHGIILGEKGRINTQAPLNRAQAAAIAVRLDKLIREEQ
jgi:hypothetical protein